MPMREKGIQKERLSRSLEELRYLNQSTPLQHKLTFNKLQNRPVGVQTAIPRDTTLEAMNSLEFRVWNER